MLRGEVWTMSLDRENRENHEFRRFPRMVIILSSDALAVLPLRVIVPLAPWKETYAGTPWLVRVPPVLNSGIEGVMAADALQVRSVSTSRLKTRLGDLPERIIDEIAAAVAMVVKA